MRDLKAFGNQLRVWREALSWSQQALADLLQERAEAGLRADFRASVDASSISQWEREASTRRPTRAYLLYLVEIFRAKGLLTDVETAEQWAKQAGYHLTTAEIQARFPLSLVAPLTTPSLDLSLSPQAQHHHAQKFKLQLLYDAIAEAKRLKQDEQAIALSIRYAKQYQQQGQYQTAISIYEALLMQSAPAGKIAYQLARAQNNLAYLYNETQTAYWPRAEDLCLQALETFKEMNAVDKLPHVYNQMGILATRQQARKAISTKP